MWMKIQILPVEFGIMSHSTLLFKKDGQVVKQVAGVHTKDQLKAIIAELSRKKPWGFLCVKKRLHVNFL